MERQLDMRSGADWSWTLHDTSLWMPNSFKNSDLQSHFNASNIGFKKMALPGKHLSIGATQHAYVQCPNAEGPGRCQFEPGKRPGGRLDWSDSLNKIAMGNCQALKHGLDRVTFHI